MWLPWIAGKTNKWVLGQIKPELSLEAKMLELRLSSFGRIMRKQNSLEKTIMLGRVEGNRKRGRSNMRWTDSLKETMGLSLQELSRVDEDRTIWRELIHRVTMTWRQFDGT